mmetsp:Transcript_33636/g.84973  ORF Transcript_33636/g.84973 Transcript_33636/m.84973 type:complete len:215 (+) Transcript_33636:1126-1770(+)
MHCVHLELLVREDHTRGVCLYGQQLQLPPHARVAHVVHKRHIPEVIDRKAILQQPGVAVMQRDAVGHRVDLCARLDDAVQLLQDVSDVPPPSTEEQLLDLFLIWLLLEDVADEDLRWRLRFVGVIVLGEDYDLVALHDQRLWRGCQVNGAALRSDADGDGLRQSLDDVLEAQARELGPRRHVELGALETKQRLVDFREARLPHRHQHQPPDHVV